MGGFRDKQGGILMAVRFLDPRKSEAGVATVAGGVDGWKRAAGAEGGSGLILRDNSHGCGTVDPWKSGTREVLGSNGVGFSQL